MQEAQEIVVLNDKELTKSRLIVNKRDIRSYLTKDQVNDVLRQMPGGKYKMIIQTLWMSGIRVTELINLKKGDIDFINSRMTVKWLKNRKWNERIIPIKQQLRDILQLYTAGMNLEQYIFPYSRQWIFAITKKHINAGPHTFRHSFAVNFLEQSKSAKALVVLKQLLGHKHIQTTMEYLRIVPNDLAIELDKVEFN